MDTLFDLELTGEMLAEMRRAVPAAAQIETVVNTHANGDHCYGNQLLAGARILASERTAAEMTELPPAAMAALVEQAPQLGTLGEFFLRCFGRVEPGIPSLDTTVAFATFSDAADQAGLSRLYGGIHFPDDNTRAQQVGHLVGIQAWRKAQQYFDGDVR